MIVHPSKEPCSAAFSQFQIDHKDSWREILTMWADIVDLDTTGMTRAHRKKEFLKHTDALVHIVRLLHSYLHQPHSRTKLG